MSSLPENDSDNFIEFNSSHDVNQNALCQFSQEKRKKRTSELNEALVKNILKDSRKKYLSNNILLIAMVEFICSVLNSNTPKKTIYNFRDICKQLVDLGLFDSVFTSDFFRPIRFEYIKFLHGVFNNTIPTQILPFNTKHKSIAFESINEKIPDQDLKIVSKLDLTNFKDINYSNFYFYNLSRYKSDFEEIDRLASGGFGSVYKAKNIIDQNLYAIKKIYFKNTNSSFCEKVIRETELFSSLDHENIVNYNSSWIELDLNEKNCQNAKEFNCSNHCKSDSWSNSDIEFDSRSNKSKSCHQISESFSNFDEKDNNKQIDKFSSNSKEKEIVSLEKNPRKNKNLHDLIRLNDVVLYIQMKLCDLTLKEWLKSRNESMFLQELKANSELNLELFRQIVSGVEYLHSKNIIHRDLKPGNIFMIREKLQIKIGDFGLACLNKLNHIVEGTNSFQVKSGHSDHTQGVGTALYASPEQLKGKKYDFKTDIFSLGIILFEFYYPFKTEMERINLINNLKKFKFPEELEKEHIQECTIISKMLSPEPSERPSAKSLLQSKLFMTKDQKIDHLQKLLEEKEKEIETLKNLLKNN